MGDFRYRLCVASTFLCVFTICLAASTALSVIGAMGACALAGFFVRANEFGKATTLTCFALAVSGVALGLSVGFDRFGIAHVLAIAFGALAFYLGRFGIAVLGPSDQSLKGW